MPTVVLSKNAEKDFSRLPETEKRKIIKKIKLIQEEPFAGKLLKGELKGRLSLRAWPYRVIYEFRPPKSILILKIIHRQGAYK